MKRVYNFNAGPATLPLEVLEEARAELVDYRGSGMSLLEASHRGAAYEAVHEEAATNIRALLGLGDDHAVLFLQGGASLQFAMVPMNLLGRGETADYVHTGSWAKKAIAEARVVATGGRAVNVAADTSAERPARVPAPAELRLTPGAAYVHVTSNETIEGIQWKELPHTDAPLVADVSSDILSRPVDATRFGLLYAGAQKNLGPAGVTVVVIRKDLAERAPDDVPIVLRYATHAEKRSLYNTPPCFAIYMVMLVTRWIAARGGLASVGRVNRDKAARLYAAIDASSFYTGTAAPDSRSGMNVTFRLPSEELEDRFVEEAAASDLIGLRGHRSVGGIRASIYNAFPVEGVDALVGFMREFERTRG